VITFRFDDTKFNVEFNAKIKAAKNRRPILMAAGREVGNQLKRHFRAKDVSGANQLSDRRSHFWLAVSRTVQNPEMENADTVSVSINHPAFAQKVFGGVIRAKAAAMLTLPVEEKAYGRTAHAFEVETGLKLFLIRTGQGAFGNAVLAVKANNDHGFIVEYVLKKSVKQKADPEALPPKSQLEAAILMRAEKVLQRQLADGAKPEE